ncbi:MAG: hypothetical protein ACO1NY_03605 [Pseudorhodoplanes sp.]
MLPDLRIVIVAVLSTFVLSVGVGFYASSRLIGEPKRSTDSIASFEETPVNRIALSWPEPTRQPEPLALDFAVTAKALRNPVRDVTSEAAPVEAANRPVRTTATDLTTVPREKLSESAPAPSAPAPVAPVPVVAAPAPVVIHAPKPAPEPDIRVAVQYPPALELPPELQAPAIPITPKVIAAPAASDAPSTTGSVTEQPNDRQPVADKPALPEADQPGKVASRPASAETDDPEFEGVPLPKPAPKIAAKKAAPKKAAARKAVRRPVRRTTPPATDAVPNFFSFFNIQQPR